MSCPRTSDFVMVPSTSLTTIFLRMRPQVNRRLHDLLPLKAAVDDELDRISSSIQMHRFQHLGRRARRLYTSLSPFVTLPPFFLFLTRSPDIEDVHPLIGVFRVLSDV